jgi:hypothetical protein
MNARITTPASPSDTATNEMLLLPDGRVLVHNLTPELARVLAGLNPNDAQLAPRALPSTEPATRNTSHELPN